MAQEWLGAWPGPQGRRRGRVGGYGAGGRFMNDEPADFFSTRPPGGCLLASSHIVDFVGNLLRQNTNNDRRKREFGNSRARETHNQPHELVQVINISNLITHYRKELPQETINRSRKFLSARQHRGGGTRTFKSSRTRTRTFRTTRTRTDIKATS